MIKKKILHLTQATGGVKTYVAHVMEFADQNIFDFVIAAPRNIFFEKFCRERAVPYYEIDLHRGNNPFKNFVTLLKIISIVRIEKPDIIHAHSAKGGFLGRIAGWYTKRKVVYTPHAFSYLPFTGAKRIIFFLLELTCLKITSKLLAISYSEANRAVNELGFDRNKVEVILNAIPIDEKLVDHVENGNLKIRMIGRLTRQKNILLFIEVAKKLLDKYPTLQFSILGAGIHDDLADEIFKFLAFNNLTDKIFIEPWGNEITSRQFLQETDIFVMTSIFEGLPFSLLEAMSLAIPCVVSKVDGNTDVINNNENGFACIDSEEFYTKIELLINNSELRKRIGKNGQNYVARNHSVANNIHKIETLYKQLLDSDELVSNKIQMVSSY